VYNPKVIDKRYPPPLETQMGPDMRAGEAESEPLGVLREVLRGVRKRLWIIVLVAVVLGGAAAVLSLAQTPMYEASIKMLVQKQGRDASDTLNGDVMGLQQLTLTMVELIQSRPVAEGVIRELDLQITPEAFLQNLSVEQVNATPVITATYEDSSPRVAQHVANTVGEVFSERAAEESPVTEDSVTVSVWERAALPESPASPSLMFNVVVALVVGVMLGVGLAFLLEYLDDSWRSPEEVEQLTGMPIYGIIPSSELSNGKKGGY
jgi:capsular polysaccharide biosynthesis protein